MREKIKITFLLNNATMAADVEPDRLLVDFLRDDLGLTGTKHGCGEGDCGACTVIVDGKAVNSCLVLAAQIDGKSVETIEGLGDYEKLHPLQQAFMDEGAVQCGYCAPGILMAAKALLDNNPRPSHEDIMIAISGNLCRCTGYVKIARAIEKAALLNRARDEGATDG